MKIFTHLILILTITIGLSALSATADSQEAIRSIYAKKYCSFKFPVSAKKQRRCVKNVDPDKDNRRNRFDNCPLSNNRSQIDSDQDGIGDACEVTDLIVLNDDNDRLTIFKDVKNKSKPYAQSDVTLANVNCLHSVALTQKGRIFVGRDCGYSDLPVYNDILTVTDNQQPDFSLTNGGYNCSLYYSSHVEIYKNDLYVLNYSQGCILIYRNADTLDETSVPDAAIVPGYGNMNTFAIDPASDRLFMVRQSNSSPAFFAGKDSSQPTPRSTIAPEDMPEDTLVFFNVSTLSGEITEFDASVELGHPRGLVAQGDRLYGSQYWANSVIGLSNPGTFTDKQTADLLLVGLESGLSSVQGIVRIGDILFINNYSRNYVGSSSVGNVRDSEGLSDYQNEILVGFRNASNLTSFQKPDIEVTPIASTYSYGSLFAHEGTIFLPDSENDSITVLLDGAAVNNSSKSDMKLFSFDEGLIDYRCYNYNGGGSCMAARTR